MPTPDDAAPDAAATPDGPAPEPVARHRAPGVVDVPPTPTRPAGAPEGSSTVLTEDPGAATGTETPTTPDQPGRHAAPPDDDLPTETRLLRRLLGERWLTLAASREARVSGWLWALAVTVFAAVIRLWDLGRPHRLVFDETYYVKQAYSMLRQGFEGSWGDDPNPGFEAGDTSMLTSDPEYVVHPPLGKWVIALGMHLGGGVTSSAAWRLSAAVVGILAVLLVARLGRRVFASTALGLVAGLLMAVDGEAIVHSRVSLLDPFLMIFVLGAFGALLLDRDQARRRLAARVAPLLDAGAALTYGPRLGWRWWRFVAAVLLGLACGVKWSAIYFIVVFGLMSVAWDVAARKAVGVRRWVTAGVVLDGIPAGVVVVGTAAVTYVAGWASWFASDSAWNRQWATLNPDLGVQWLPPALRSWWQYHLDMWHFHNNLTSEHSYDAHPLGWIVQWRPTSFFYPPEVSELTGQDALDACGAAACSQAITSLGNPVLWWCAAASVIVAVWFLVRHRDWRAGAVLSGIAAGWLPWFAYAERTIFTFYSIAFTPWVVLTLTYVLGLVIGPPDEDPRRRRQAIMWVSALVAFIVVVSAFFYPVWTAWIVPYDFWHLHMWLPSWV